MNKAEMIDAVQQGSGLDLSAKATGDILRSQSQYSRRDRHSVRLGFRS